MSELITLRLHASGFTDIQAYRVPYERAKAEASVGDFLARQITNLETDVEVHEPDGTVVDVETGAIFPPPAPVYLIWSLQHLSWWKPEAAGYTGDLWAAGRFTEAEALNEPLDDSLIVPAPESGRSGSFDVGELGRMRALMEDRIDAVKAGVAAVKEQIR